MVLTRDADRAEDLVQESLVRALAGASTWQPGANLRTWLLSIVHNTCVSGWRREQSERRGLAQLFPDAAEPSEPPSQIAVVEAHQVMGALLRLPDGARDILMLAAVEGLSYREIAEVQGVPLGTVMSRLSRAREQLRQQLAAAPPIPASRRPHLTVVE